MIEKIRHEQFKDSIFVAHKINEIIEVVNGFTKKEEVCAKLKKLKKSLTFCTECGEYIMDDGGCSNPWCPEIMEG